MQYESTNAFGLTESNETKLSQWCLVFERDTGKVINIYQYFPLTSDDLLSTQRLEEMALSEIDPGSRKAVGSLGLFHPDREMKFDHRIAYSIDLKSNSIDAQPIDPHERMSELKKIGDGKV